MDVLRSPQKLEIIGDPSAKHLTLYTTLSEANTLLKRGAFIKQNQRKDLRQKDVWKMWCSEISKSDLDAMDKKSSEQMPGAGEEI